MQVVLTQDVPKLGRKYEVVNVKPGFAHNWLFMKGFAMPATPKRIVQANKKLDAILIRKEQIQEKAADIKKTVEELGTIVIAAKITDKGNLYAAVAERDIIQKVEEKLNVRLEKKHVKFVEPIKEVGAHKVVLRLAEGITADLNVEVEPLK